MARRLPIILLIMLLAAAPLLACLPMPNMTAAEMACCKKMAGNCEMGTSAHSCCKTTASTPQLTAISHNRQVLQLQGLLALTVIFTNADISLTSKIFSAVPSPIPISPPGSPSILRI
jgi:hypothetical protein